MRPMLAARAARLEDLRYPMLASPKLDGIRALMVAGMLLSRTFKPIPNRDTQLYFRRYPHELQGLDGELIYAGPSDDVYRRTMSAVMTRTGNPMDKLFWFIFDRVGPEPFEERLADAKSRLSKLPPECAAQFLPHIMVGNPEEVLDAHESAVAAGHEGLILRDLRAPYKEGRSTLGEQGMVKVKMFSDSEAQILERIELMHNGNEATVNELGLTKRSSHQANKVGMQTLGSLRVRDVKTGVEFEIGTGFDDQTRRAIWAMPRVDDLFVKYKYFAYGVKDRPRHPVFLGFRDKRDM